MEKLLLGIDIGTSACKAAVFSLDGAVVAEASVPWPVLHPAPGWAEQDPQEWWRGACLAVRKALSSGCFHARQIAAVAVDGQSWAAVPVDRQGRPLHNSPIWMDTRAADIAREMAERAGFERILQVCGNPPEPTYSTAKILWFKKHRPDLYRETFLFLQSNGYIVLKLTGRFTQDVSQGFGLHCFDISTQRWHDALCTELGLDGEKLPELCPCSAVVGEVTAAAAAETGLMPGTPVVAGALDSACGALGAGVCHAGQTQEQGGTAGGLGICMNKPLAHPKLILSAHAAPGLWLLHGACTGGGGSLKWFLQELGGHAQEQARRENQNPFDVLCAEAATVPPGAGGTIFLPYMAGERSPIWDRHASGVFFGLGYGKARAHLVRSVMEGCAFALEHNLQTAYETGVTVESMHAAGGTANSHLWAQIKADVTGKTIKVASSDTATTLGAAMLAGVGAGLYRNVDDAVMATVRTMRTHEPDPSRHALYRRYYGLYRELYDNLKDTMEKTGRLAQELHLEQ